MQNIDRIESISTAITNMKVQREMGELEMAGKTAELAQGWLAEFEAAFPLEYVNVVMVINERLTREMDLLREAIAATPEQDEKATDEMGRAFGNKKVYVYTSLAGTRRFEVYYDPHLRLWTAYEVCPCHRYQISDAVHDMSKDEAAKASFRAPNREACTIND